MKVFNTLILLGFMAFGLVVPAKSATVEPAWFTQPELDQMLAPVALYPDTVLSHVLIAATYPLEVVQAARWSRANPGLQGEAAVTAVEHMDWDPSVKVLVAFPELIQRMDEDLEWTQRLGDAFLLQEEQVVDTIQYLRSEAYAHGALQSNEHVRVVRETEYIYIEPARPHVVYVPYYDPYVVYPHWRWAHYPPVFWPHPPGFRVSLSFFWGTGFHVAPSYFYFSAFHWPHRQVVVVHHHNQFHGRRHFSSGRDVVRHRTAAHWKHDPVRRQGVAYRHGVDERRFTRESATPLSRGALAREARRRDERSGWTTASTSGQQSTADTSVTRDSARGPAGSGRSRDGVRSTLRESTAAQGAAPQRSVQSRSDAATLRSTLQDRNTGQSRQQPSAQTRSATRPNPDAATARNDSVSAQGRGRQNGDATAALREPAPGLNTGPQRSAQSRADTSSARPEVQGRDGGPARQLPSARQVEPAGNRPAVAQSAASQRADVRSSVQRQPGPAVRSASNPRSAMTAPQQSRQAPAAAPQRPAASALQRSQPARSAMTAPQQSRQAPAAAPQQPAVSAPQRSQPAARPAQTQRPAQAMPDRSRPASAPARQAQPVSRAAPQGNARATPSAPAQRGTPAQPR